jgi:cytochrome c peroxidase
MMKKAIIYILLFITSGMFFTVACKKISSTSPVPESFVTPDGWPQPMYLFSQNPLTQEGIALGKKIFYDTRLSSDGQVSCGSCHQQFAGFTHADHNLAHGVNNQFTTRNPPALANLAWRSFFMHDGGINHLDVLPIAPITAPNEMGETLNNVLNKLRADATYRIMFKNAFGTEDITTERLTKALSQFTLTLVSSNSKYDRVKKGIEIFSTAEQLGYDLFKVKCASCHTEPFFTDFSYRNIGMPIDPFLKDEGRKHITGLSSDSLKFMVPSLRNVGVSGPYGHDGRFFAMVDVMNHYRNGVTNSPTLDPLLSTNGIPLSNFQVSQLVAFLYTLTDTAFLKNKKFAEY